MAGRGTAEQAPAVQDGTGYEYRAVTAPDRLFPLAEPFGKDENNIAGVYEPGMKTGSMVSAFVNAYVEETKVPVVGVSCSKGGSAIAEWPVSYTHLPNALQHFPSGHLCPSFPGTAKHPGLYPDLLPGISHRDLPACFGI